MFEFFLSRKAFSSCYCLLLCLFLHSSHIESLAREPTIGNNSQVPVNYQQTLPEAQALSAQNPASQRSFGAPPSARVNSDFNTDEIFKFRSNITISARSESPRYDGPMQDTRVPFWNIAHMINSIDQIGPALREGSNGIEVDISFDKRGYPIESYHGFPCDCGRHCYHRENLVKFVQHVAHITSPPESSRLLVILFDLKLKDLNTEQKEVGGRQLATILHEHLYKRYQAGADRYRGDLIRPPVRVVVSINHVTDSALIRSFIDYMIENRLDFMRSNVGFDVGMNDDLNEISGMWNNFRGQTFNIWQGDGLTNCANIIRGVDRLKDSISIRNSQGHFRKIYYWTADVMYQMRAVLRLGTDALLTNQPQRLVQVLEEPEFRGRYRLATPYDDPFAQFWIQPSAWEMAPPTLDELEETVTNIKKTSTNFVKTLPTGIVAALKKVHNSLVSSD